MTKKIPYSAFKHGQRCTCEIDGEKVTDAKIDIDSNGSIYISQEGKDRRKVVSGGVHYTEYNFGNITNLTLLPRTIEDVEEGDEIVSKDVGERKVLGRCGQIVFLGRLLSNDAYENTYSIHDLKFRGYTIKQDTPPEEEQERESKLFIYDNVGKKITNPYIEPEKITHSVSMEEIADKFNIPLDQLRIKE